MNTAFIIGQIVIGVLLVISIILQTRGSTVGIAFGGSGESYRSKRGLEKLLFYATIVLAVLFASISILSLLFS
jgi:protein translocase SecG subunit